MAVSTITQPERVHSDRLRGRGRPQMVTERASTAFARLIEGQAFASEVLAAAELIVAAAAVGSRQLIAHEAGRLGVRAQAYQAELHRLAGELEK